MHMVSLRKSIAAVAVPIAMALTLGTGTASAASTSRPALTVHSAVKGATANSACAITVYGYTGYRVCEFAYSSLDWGGGNVEVFVVGTDYAIYHIWNGSGGWHSLGGMARNTTPNGAYAFNSPSIGVETIGTDNNWYCNYWGSASWSGWQRC
jgi:hypothetical protein